MTIGKSPFRTKRASGFWKTPSCTTSTNSATASGRVKGHMFDAFGHYESEISASWLVRFAQQRGEGWKPFTYEDIEKFYSKSDYMNFSFNRLIDGGFIHLVPGGVVGNFPTVAMQKPQYHFTEEFISRCYKSATRP